MNEIKLAYVEAIQLLAKAVGNEPPRNYHKSVVQLQNAAEPKALKAVQKIIRTARLRFLKRFKVDKLKFAKADDNAAIKAELLDIMEAAFVGASEELVTALEDHVDEIAKNFSSVYDVKIKYDIANDEAINYLKDNLDNYFTTLSDDAAEGIKNSIVDGMNTEGGYDINDLVDNIRSTWGKDTIDLPTKTLQVDDWSMLVARSEVARATSFSQRSALESIGMATWQWQSSSECCDECDTNDGEIVSIGDDFTTGDSEPPVHPNCLCITIAVSEELTGASSDDSEDDEENSD